eukprot:COSAG02_NODE_8258_length_2639_cov_1.270866_1_plen_79_part_10
MHSAGRKRDAARRLRGCDALMLLVGSRRIHRGTLWVGGVLASSFGSRGRGLPSSLPCGGLDTGHKALCPVSRPQNPGIM